MNNNTSEPRRRRRRKRLPEALFRATIEAMSDEGRGIAHVDGRAVFIDQALPGEEVEFRYTRLTSKVAEGRAENILEPSADRVEPKCSAFGRCGGCSLQHMRSDAQLRMKQDSLLRQLSRIGGVKPQTVLTPVQGPVWGYRTKARLGVRYVAKKERVLVGFRERSSSFITETDRCEVLDPRVGTLIEALSESISAMQARKVIPQIEVATDAQQAVLIVRHLEPLEAADRDVLEAFARQQDVTVMLQPGKPETTEALWPRSPGGLHYGLDAFDVNIAFQASDFTQVNPAINRSMVSRTVELLELESTHRVLDLFCGLGNFTLPIATRCAQVTGVEGSLDMVRKARDNAQRNRIDNAEFSYADLYGSDVKIMPWARQLWDRVLLDPPRSGAAEILPYFKTMKPERIVYVSCHPATLARDAGILVNELGYRLTHAGIMDMFPHTAHVESMAVFAA